MKRTVANKLTYKPLSLFQSVKNMHNMSDVDMKFQLQRLTHLLHKDMFNSIHSFLNLLGRLFHHCIIENIYFMWLQ